MSRQEQLSTNTPIGRDNWTYTSCASALHPLKASAVNIKRLWPAETKSTTVNLKETALESQLSLIPCELPKKPAIVAK